jgi:hypothetical protein
MAPPTKNGGDLTDNTVPNADTAPFRAGRFILTLKRLGYGNDVSGKKIYVDSITQYL